MKNEEYCSSKYNRHWHSENPSEKNMFYHVWIDTIFPAMFFYHCSCYTRAHHVSGRYGETEVRSKTYCCCCDESRRCSLRIIHFMFPDFFTDCFHDSFPSYKCPTSDCYRYKHNNPPWNIVSCYREISNIFIDIYDLSICSCSICRWDE